MDAICHVQLFPILSGVQRAMLSMLDRLDRTRYEPHVVCREPGPLSEELRARGIECHFVPSMIRPIRPMDDLRAYRDLYQLFRQHRFRLVHTHSSKPGVLGRLAARRAGVPAVVHHVQSFAFHEFSSWRASLFYGSIEWFAGLCCDRVVFVNNEDRELAVRWRLLPADKCLTVYNGVDLCRFDPQDRAERRARFRRGLDLADGERAILYLGRFDEQKQPLILPEIAARMRSISTRAPWRLILAGSGPFEPHIRAAIERNGLADQVSLVGWFNEPETALVGCDMLLHPSLWEGLPLSIAEAQAAGLPVVASDVKGNREVVAHGETGYLCPPRDSAAYARHLAVLVDDESLRKTLSQQAVERARALFDDDKNLPRIQQLYDQLLGHDSPASRRPRDNQSLDYRRAA